MFKSAKYCSLAAALFAFSGCKSEDSGNNSGGDTGNNNGNGNDGDTGSDACSWSDSAGSTIKYKLSAAGITITSVTCADSITVSNTDVFGTLAKADAFGSSFSSCNSVNSSLAGFYGTEGNLCTTAYYIPVTAGAFSGKLSFANVKDTQFDASHFSFTGDSKCGTNSVTASFLSALKGSAVFSSISTYVGVLTALQTYSAANATFDPCTSFYNEVCSYSGSTTVAGITVGNSQTLEFGVDPAGAIKIKALPSSLTCAGVPITSVMENVNNFIAALPNKPSSCGASNSNMNAFLNGVTIDPCSTYCTASINVGTSTVKVSLKPSATPNKFDLKVWSLSCTNQNAKQLSTVNNSINTATMSSGSCPASSSDLIKSTSGASPTPLAIADLCNDTCSDYTNTTLAGIFVASTKTLKVGFNDAGALKFVALPTGLCTNGVTDSAALINANTYLSSMISPPSNCGNGGDKANIGAFFTGVTIDPCTTYCPVGNAITLSSGGFDATVYTSLKPNGAGTLDVRVYSTSCSGGKTVQTFTLLGTVNATTTCAGLSDTDLKIDNGSGGQTAATRATFCA